MSLELQVKTTRQVIDSALGTENWDLKGLGITEAKFDFEKPMWITLDEAQKREFALLDQIIIVTKLNDDKFLKIAEANKALDAFESVWGKTAMFGRLRQILLTDGNSLTEGKVHE
jgi:hypothetical protein